MNGRLYDPVVGRFLNADPVIQDPGNTQSYNRYSYCLNNPLKYSDPSGYINQNPQPRPAEGVSGGGGSAYGSFFYQAMMYNTWRTEALTGRGGSGGNMGGSRSSGGSSAGSYYYNRFTGEYTDSWGNTVSYLEVHNNYILKNATERYGITQTATSLDGGKTFTGNGNYSLVRLGHGVESTGLYPTFTINRDAQGQGGYSGDGPLFTVADWINNGIGGLATGMKRSGGTFRLTNSTGFSLKYYASGWRGNGSVNTYNSATWGSRIAKGSLFVNLGLGAYSINKANIADGRTFGYNTQVATGKFVGGMAGSIAGAEIGAAIGVWFGGVGAIPGVVIGGVVGGVFGGWGGSELGGAAVKWAY